MNREGDLDSREIVMSELVTLHIGLRSNEGKLFLDARKWLKYPAVSHHVPSKKGLMMEISDWKQAMPLIQELLDSVQK